jgi:EAL domain-containing protein (putative c-di-GMP-specific phosphodiesterase class I)
VALAQADRSLYQAKRAGRDRILAHPLDEQSMPSDVTEPRIVLQPIVDLHTGEVVAYEALSRFDGASPQSMFHRAAEQGWGDVLEARAILAALAIPGRPDVPLHVNASAAAMQSQRFWQLSPEDLEGIVVEISEDFEPAELADLRQSIARLRARGAQIATDDLGSGSHELLRLAAMRPEVVKLDRSLVDGCADDIGRQAVIRGGLEFARSLGSRLCAEGARHHRDLAQLRALGVRYVQCFLIAEPSDAWGRAVVQLPAESAPRVSTG